MKTDWKLWAAILILIGLVGLLIALSVQRSQEVQNALQEIEKIKKSIPKITQPKDGSSPVLGKDYFVTNGKDAPIYSVPKDGRDSMSTLLIKEVPVNGLSAYELAIKDGFQGTLNQWLDSLKVPGEKGDTGGMLLTTCVDGKLSQKLSSDFVPQPILVDGKYIKCELSDE